MKTIIHKIKLKDVADVAKFKDWVENKDYVACQQLPSVKRFSVHHVSSDPNAQYHFFEVIRITDMAAFETDMATDVFASLVSAFDQMAEVVEEMTGEKIGNGYVE